MSNEDIYKTAMAGYQAALVEEEAAFQRAQISGDHNEAVRASQSMASIRTQANEYHRMALSHAQSLRSAAQADHSGLTEQEREAALNSFGPIKITDENGRSKSVDLTKEQKIALYKENKSKLAHLRATGQYATSVQESNNGKG